MDIEEVIARLSQPFPVEALHFRVGATSKDKSKGIALAYIDARDAMRLLDSVVGAQNWQRRYPWSDGQRLYCEVGIRFDGEWVWKGDGAGETQVEAEKGAFSDAFKRACVNWGIAQYLYSCPNTWYPLEPAGRSYKFSGPTQDRIRQDIGEWQKRMFGANDYLLNAAIKAIEADDVFQFMEVTRKDQAAWNGLFGKLNSHQKSRVRTMEQKCSEAVAQYVDGIREAISNSDLTGLSELKQELQAGTQLKIAVGKDLSADEIAHLKKVE